ncbi:unannotated protein [freshwater metagenome]|uniref:Unannotated protein n=1 Tax=freshwater metagenome TaxID=449393 RepID=A0A6J6XE17_9ZZZZ
MTLDDLETKPAAPDIMRLACDHLPLGLPLRSSQLLALPLDPRETVDHRQPNLIVVHLFRRSDAYTPHRWVYADVQVLDFLVNDINVDAANGEVCASGTHDAPSPVRTPHQRDRSPPAGRP